LSAQDGTELQRALEQMCNLTLDGHRVRHVLLEQRVTFQRELYVAIMLDRDRQTWMLLVSPAGGIEVESEAESTVRRWSFSHLLGIPGYVRQQAAVHLGLIGQTRTDFSRLLDQLYSIVVGWGAVLVEINPLVMTEGGILLPLDAKIVLDDNARRRWPEPIESHIAGDIFEQALFDLGVVGVNIPDGKVAVITSGAGIAMATMDCLAAYGGTTRAFVDLGGAVIRDFYTSLAAIETLRDEVAPEVYLFNFFFQLADSRVLAAAIQAAFASRASRVVARFKGKNDAQARETVAGVATKVTSEFIEACKWAAELSGESSGNSGR
jgi:succinyl-CoA synthetase beta subunit